MEKTPNDKFRDARESTQSQDHPNECLSRQEVADKANAWIWERHGKKYDLNANYVGKIEQGIIRWPTYCAEQLSGRSLRYAKTPNLGSPRGSKAG